MTTQRDIFIRRGETFVLTVRWETEPWMYAAIASISQTAPARITLQGAGATIPPGWRVAVVDAKGMTELNATGNPPKNKDLRRAAVVSDTELELSGVSAAGFGKHQANSGYLAWMTPHSLDDFYARLQIKDRPGGAVLHTATSLPLGGIVISDAEKTIEFKVDAVTAESFAWSSGVYDLEMISAGGTVTALLEGAVTVGAEVTTIA